MCTVAPRAYPHGRALHYGCDIASVSALHTVAFSQSLSNSDTTWAESPNIVSSKNKCDGSFDMTCMYDVLARQTIAPTPVQPLRDIVHTATALIQPRYHLFRAVSCQVSAVTCVPASCSVACCQSHSQIFFPRGVLTISRKADLYEDVCNQAFIAKA